MRKKNKNYSLEESLGHLASQASRIVLKRINQELVKRNYPITSDQFSILVYIWNGNGQPQYALAESLNKDKTTMARFLSSLERLGLIARLPGSEDGREKKVYLTDQGVAMMSEVIEIVQEVLDTATAGIDEESLTVCKDVLRKFYRNLL